MNILLCSTLAPGAMSLSIIRVLTSMGHNVACLDYRHHRDIMEFEKANEYSRSLIYDVQNENDLIIMLKGDLIFDKDKLKIPAVLWFMDEVNRYIWFDDIYKIYDITFTSDPLAPNNTKYLPVGVDLNIHHPVNTKLEHDVVFAGSGRIERYEIMRRMWKNHKIRVCGNHWTGREEFFYGGEVYDEDLCKFYSSSKWVFNDIRGEGINSRVLETMAIMGGILITNKTIGTSQYFNSGEHLFYYDGLQDIDEIIANPPDDLEEIRMNAYNEVIKNHTIYQKVKLLIEEFT